MFIHIGRITFRIANGVAIDALAIEIIKLLKTDRDKLRDAASLIAEKLEVMDGDDTLKILTIMCMRYETAYPEIGIVYSDPETITIYAKIADRSGQSNPYVEGIYTVAVINNKEKPDGNLTPITSPFAINEMKYGCNIL